MKIKNKILFVLLPFLAISCDKKRVFDEYKSVGNAWHKDSIVSFELPKLDPKETYNLFINVRDNDNYAFNNLFLIVVLEEPNKRIIVDTLEYQMTNPDGTLLGDGFTDIKENKLFFKENVKFNQDGIYKVRIQQAVRQNQKIEGVSLLKGISDVGFRIETLEKNYGEKK
jgi:gliding motility-associated lipoprotein GldH